MYSLTEQDVAILFDIYRENDNSMPEDVIQEFYKRKFKGVYTVCLAKIQEYENTHNAPAKYIFISQNTFNALKSHIYTNSLFDLAREIGSAATCFLGCKVCVADIGDDEIFVVGEN